MTPLSRSLTGPLLTFDLEDQLGELRNDPAYARSGRAGRTLAKEGAFRLFLVALGRDVDVGTHHTEHPITVHVISGAIRFRIEDERHELRAGQLLYFGPGAAHDIRATEETALLLSIAVRSSSKP